LRRRDWRQDGQKDKDEKSMNRVFHRGDSFRTICPTEHMLLRNVSAVQNASVSTAGLSVAPFAIFLPILRAALTLRPLKFPQQPQISANLRITAVWQQAILFPRGNKIACANLERGEISKVGGWRRPERGQFRALSWSRSATQTVGAVGQSANFVSTWKQKSVVESEEWGRIPSS
jgi:hypothetical protein